MNCRRLRDLCRRSVPHLIAGLLLVSVQNVCWAASAASSWWRESPGFTDDITRSFVIASNDIWWVSEYDALVHWDGVALAKIRIDTTINVKSLWAAGPREIYLSGTTGVWRGDGSRWDQVADFRGANVEIGGIWGTSSRDIFVSGKQRVGGKALVFHFDGRAWTPVTIGKDGASFPVWGTSSKDIIAAGPNGLLSRFDGSTWKTMVLAGETGPLHALWIRSASDIWAAGDKGALFHGDGKTWSTVDHPPCSAIQRIWGDPSGKIYVIAGDKFLSFDGTKWSTSAYPTHGTVWSICGTSDRDIYIAGGNGAIFHYDGRDWSSVGNVTTQSLNGIWGTPGGPVWAVGAGGTLLRREAGTWKTQTPPIRNFFTDVWGSSQQDIFVVGGKGGSILHFDGGTWQTMPSPTNEILTSLWGTGPRDVFAGGTGTLLHYDGQAWSVMQEALWNKVSVVGIWGSSANDVFAITSDYYSQGGRIFHYDGATWTPMLQDESLKFRAIWGSGPRDVYAVGSRTFLHYDGRTWSPVPGAAQSFTSIGGTSPTDIYLSGGKTMHFDGKTLTPIETGELRGITRLWVDPSGHLYGLGEQGGLIRRSPGTLLPPPEVKAGTQAAADRIALSWRASDRATSYNVFRAANEESPWMFAGSTRETSFSENVPPGSSYLYRVNALNEADESAPSAIVRVTAAPEAVRPSSAGPVALQPVVPPAPAVEPPRFDVERAREAAYFGEVGTLRGLIDAWPREAIAREGVPAWEDLLTMAMIGRQREAVKLILGYGIRKQYGSEDFNSLFAPAVMDAACARLLLDAPGFKEMNGDWALRVAVKAGNLAAATELLNAGVDVKAGAGPNSGEILMAAPLLARDEEMLKLLLSKGADPYVLLPYAAKKLSFIDWAAGLQSSRILRLLDVRNLKTDLIRELEEKAPAADSPFIGFWKGPNRGGPTSFGQMEFFPDGSCRKDGMIPFFWEQTGPTTARLTSPPPSAGPWPASPKPIEVTLVRGLLSIVSPEADGVAPLVRAAAACQIPVRVALPGLHSDGRRVDHA